MFVKIFQVSSDEGMGKLGKVVEFSTQKHFKIGACVISARRAKHLAPTHLNILSCKHISRPIRARAYYLRACLHGVGDPGLVGEVSFVYCPPERENKRNQPH